MGDLSPDLVAGFGETNKQRLNPQDHLPPEPQLHNMPSITSGRDATLLQLQYLANSLGLRRSYLEEDDYAQEKNASNPIVTHVAVDEPENLVKPCPHSLSKPVTRPDIEWLPNYDTYQARVARLAQSRCDRPKTLPEGFPARVSSPRAWTGSDFSDPENYLVHLSFADVEEIKAALEHFKSTSETRLVALPPDLIHQAFRP